MRPEDVLGIKDKATEETLQSIDSTLKRIEVILRQEQAIKHSELKKDLETLRTIAECQIQKLTFMEN